MEATAIPENAWRATNPDDLIWTEWDGEFILYHKPSGKTHLVNEVSKSLLTKVLVGFRSTKEVALELSGVDDVVSAKDYLEQIVAMLDRFEEMGLVEKA